MKDNKVEGLKKRLKADMIFSVVVTVIMMGVTGANFASYFVHDGNYSEIASFGSLGDFRCILV